MCRSLFPPGFGLAGEIDRMVVKVNRVMSLTGNETTDGGNVHEEHCRHLSARRAAGSRN